MRIEERKDNEYKAFDGGLDGSDRDVGAAGGGGELYDEHG
jgi:hypothetical protein